MHDVLRERLRRQIDALPEEQIYRVLDYIEFLTSKYARGSVTPPASAIQRFGERLEDRLRVNRVGFDAIRTTLNAFGAADRVVSGLAEAGRSILGEPGAAQQGAPPQSAAPPPKSPGSLQPPRTDPSEPSARRPDIIIDD